MPPFRADQPSWVPSASPAETPQVRDTAADPHRIGLRLLPMSGSLLAIAPVAGRLADRIGSRGFMTAGRAEVRLSTGGAQPVRRRHGMLPEVIRHG